VVFNDGLHARQEAHAAGERYITDAELSARLTAAKAAPERAWLGEVSAVVLQQALADLNAAYRNFFASLTGRRTVVPRSFTPHPIPRQAQSAMFRRERQRKWQTCPRRGSGGWDL
jgi:putative transposase